MRKIQNLYDVAVIGGGAAGLMSTLKASENSKVNLLERNKQLGKKLKLTGNGRCNVTTSKNVDDIVAAFGKKGDFFYGALTRFSNQMLVAFFEENGVKLKEERGDRIFPESDDANEILNFFKNKINFNDVKISYGFRVSTVSVEDDVFEVEGSGGQKIYSKTIIIATGGKTYPSTGSTGDGYELAKQLGHTINEIKPALVPLIVESEKIRSLAGLSLRNIKLKFKIEGESFWEGFGEMLFTHRGISGPLVLEASKKVGEELDKGLKVSAAIDLKAALSKEQLRKRINRDIESNPKIQYNTLLAGLLPRSLIEYYTVHTMIKKDRQVSTLTREEKFRLLELLKDFRFNVDGVEPVEAGIITAGGVELDEIDSTTMESKIVPGLYFAGEVIDLDGPTGGFNLQLAWSTGYIAGMNAAKKRSGFKG